MKIDKFQDLIDISIKAKECNRDIALELTVPEQKETEIIIVKNENIDYKMNYLGGLNHGRGNQINSRNGTRII